MDIQDLKRRAGIVEDEAISECPDTDGLVSSASKKIRKVMNALRSGNVDNKQMFSVLQSAVMDLSMAEKQSQENHMGDQNGDAAIS